MATQQLFILTGPSGVGKATVSSRVLERVPKIAKVVTYTTRQLRAGEVNHKTYHFISPEEFERKIRAGELFEWEKVYGDAWYGSPSDPFENVPQGYDALLEIGVGGMKSYLQAFPEAVTIFLAPPSLDAVLDRIEKRGAGEANLDNRLRSAAQMLEQARTYHYVVVNDDLENAVNQLVSIIIAERARRQRREILKALEQQLLEWKSRHSLS